MKRIYFTGLALLAGSLTMAQQAPTTVQKRDFKQKLKTSNGPERTAPSAQIRAGGDVIWDDDFATDPLTNNWTTTGSDGAIWLHDTDGPNGFFSDPTQEIITSTTAGNGFMIFDSDFANNQGSSANQNEDNQWQGNLVSPVIDLSGNPDALLEFEHAYRICCFGASEIAIDVSTDNFSSVSGTWDARDPDIASTAASGTILRSINISEAIADDPSNVQFRFRWGEPGNAFNGSHYFWQVDDIKIVENYENDLIMDTVRYGYDPARDIFTVLPDELKDLNTFVGYVKNNGSQARTNVRMAVEELSGALPVAYSAPLASLDPNLYTTQFSVDVDLTPLTVGQTYTFAIYPQADETEESTANDTVYYNINVSETTYGLYRTTGLSAISGSDYPTAYNSGAGFGAEFFMPSDWKILFVGAAFADDAANDGAFMTIEIYDLDPAATEPELIHSQDVTVDGTQLAAWQQFQLDSVITLQAGHEVWAIIRDYDGNSVMLAGGSTDFTAGLMPEYDATGTMTPILAPSVPLVYISSFGVGINENNTLNISTEVYPNPVTDMLQIDLDLENEGDFNYYITDLNGRIITKKDIGQLSPGKHQISLSTTHLATGSYLLHISSGDKVTSKKIVKH